MKKKLTCTIAALAVLAVIAAIGIFSINQKITEGGGCSKREHRSAHLEI